MEQKNNAFYNALNGGCMVTMVDNQQWGTVSRGSQDNGNNANNGQWTMHLHNICSLFNLKLKNSTYEKSCYL